MPLKKIDFISKNTIRDGGSTVLYDAYIVDTVGSVGTVYTVMWLKLLIWVSFCREGKMAV